MHTTDVLFWDAVLPDDVITCSGGHCTNQGHVNMLSNIYGHIMNCLWKADEICIPKKHIFYSCSRLESIFVWAV